jgi:hypothetical protein
MNARLAIVLAIAALFASSSASAQPSAAGPDAGVGASAQEGSIASAPEPTLREPPPEARPTIESTVTPTEGLVTGDVVTWTLKITSREGDDVTVIGLDEAMGSRAADRLADLDRPVHLLDESVDEAEAHDGHRTRTCTARFLLLAPGEQTLPALVVRVLTAGGQLGFVRPEAPVVQVGAVLANEPNAAPKPLTDPVSVMEDDPRPLYAGAALLAMLAGALLAFLVSRWWKRRSRRPAPPPPPRPAWEVAVAKLDDLLRSRDALLAEGRAVEWADGVSDVIREYLGARYGFDGLESTTDEVLERLAEAPLRGVAVPEVAVLLQDCDLVKFAKASMGEAESQALLAAGYRIVRATTPLPEASSPDQGAPPGGPS